MFYQIRYQTGEIENMIDEMKKGSIPCMDVDDMNEFNWVVDKLEKNNIYFTKNIPLNRDARDRIKEPEFEFRAAFSLSKDSEDNLMYIDFYFEPIIEKDYDPIFGD